MHRTEAAHAGLTHSSCISSDVDWQTTVSALSRASRRYGEILVSAGGNRAEAASLLWQRSRHDMTLRDDLAKAACALLALAPGEAEGSGERPASGWQRRPGKLSKLDRDPEVAAFLSECLESMYVDEALARAKQQFGADRVPGRSAAYHYWQQQRRARQAT